MFIRASFRQSRWVLQLYILYGGYWTHDEFRDECVPNLSGPERIQWFPTKVTHFQWIRWGPPSWHYFDPCSLRRDLWIAFEPWWFVEFVSMTWWRPWLSWTWSADPSGAKTNRKNGGEWWFRDTRIFVWERSSIPESACLKEGLMNILFCRDLPLGMIGSVFKPCEAIRWVFNVVAVFKNWNDPTAWFTQRQNDITRI